MLRVLGPVSQDGQVHDSYVLHNSRADRRSCFVGGAPNATSSQQ